MTTASYQEGLLKKLQEPEYASEYLNEALKEMSQVSIHAGASGRSKG